MKLEDVALQIIENAEFGAQVELSEWDWRGEALRESLERNIASRLATLRRETLEEAAKVAEAMEAETLARQYADADDLGFKSSINANIRMMALLLPRAAERIRALMDEKGER